MVITSDREKSGQAEDLHDDRSMAVHCLFPPVQRFRAETAFVRHVPSRTRESGSRSPGQCGGDFAQHKASQKRWTVVVLPWEKGSIRVDQLRKFGHAEKC